MNKEYCIVTTTCDSKECCDKIIRSLFDQKLASCIQTHNINSTYMWKNNIENNDEIILYIKTKRELYLDIEKCILDNHTYEVPQIIMLPIINGYKGYLDWIDEVTK